MLTALTSVAQMVGCCPAKLKVAGLIPSQDTCLGCGPDLQLGEHERQPINVSLAHRCFSPFISPSLPLSQKTQINVKKKNN